MDAMPARDRLDEEIEALLAIPEIGDSVERQIRELRAGTLKTIPDAIVRARMDGLERARQQAQRAK